MLQREIERALAGQAQLRDEMAKYHNRRVIADGYGFDSQAEFARYGELVLLQQAGAISDLVVHPRYVLLDKTPTERATVYVGDFAYTEGGQKQVVEDVKGVETTVFRLKAAMFRRRYPGVELRIVRA